MMDDLVAIELGSAYPIKILDTDRLIEVAQHSRVAGYNRVIYLEGVPLDPSGTHILQPVMVHQHAQGISVAPHLRCYLYLKIIDEAEPWKSFFDISLNDYRSLPLPHIQPYTQTV